MRATVERQQAEIGTLTQRVDSLTGANTVLIASDNAEKGTAYQCAAPSTAAASHSGS